MIKLASDIDAFPPPQACVLAVPPWVDDLVRGGTSREFIAEGGLHVSVCAGNDHALVSVRVPDADAGNAAEFERCTLLAYRTLAEILCSLETPHPIRFWNFIPHIRTGSNTGLDRYMVFNAGRFAALTEWFGGQRPSRAHVATASGVGHLGTALAIHALAARMAGRHVENPRQVPSFEYSRKYGPVPPCFARATWLQEQKGKGILLIGGTSSVCGEESVHGGDAAAQTRETLTNMRHLLGTVESAGMGDRLVPLRSVRAYYVRESDRDAIAAELRAAFSPETLRAIEYVQADLCRPELLVEIEGDAIWV